MKDTQYDIFISYRREDGAEFAEGLYKTLVSKGYRVFFDKSSLCEGREFPTDIRNALFESSEFVAVITNSYFGSNKEGISNIQYKDDWVRQEIALSLSKKDMSYHPILVDCEAPLKNDLPKDIQKFSNKSFFAYNRAYDTFDKIVEILISQFQEKTIENAVVGNIFSALNTIDINDDKQFNVACKQIISLITQDRDIKALLHILAYKKEGSSKYYYRNDYRFVAFYVLFTHYRRNHEIIKLIDFIELYRDSFPDRYPFMNFVMIKYSLEKFNLAKNGNEENKYLTDALKYARKAIQKIPSNLGILHSFSVVVATSVENGVDVKEEDLALALKNVNYIIDENPKYGGIYYATKARLLLANNDYKNALKYIRYAQTMESPEHDDWILRIANYQKYELMIRMKM